MNDWRSAPCSVAGMEYLLLCKVTSCSLTLTQVLLFLQLSKYRRQTCMIKVHTSARCGFHVQLVFVFFSWPSSLWLTYVRKKKGIMEGCLVCEESEGERCCLCVWELKNPEMPEQQQQGIYSVNSYFMLLVFNGKTNKSTKIEILSFTF